MNMSPPSSGSKNKRSERETSMWQVASRAVRLHETSSLYRETAGQLVSSHELDMVAFIRLMEQDSVVAKDEMITRMRWGGSVHVLCFYLSSSFRSLFLFRSFRSLPSSFLTHGVLFFLIYRSLIIAHIFHFHWQSYSFLSSFFSGYYCLINSTSVRNKTLWAWDECSSMIYSLDFLFSMVEHYLLVRGNFTFVFHQFLPRRFSPKDELKQSRSLEHSSS
jgi:hypothetical protein